jgi:anaerobic dimethyl sulfoxide reductase subunit A
MGNRGDMNGFQRITWEQAFTEIAAKMQDVKSRFGAYGFHGMYASGDATGWASSSVSRLHNLMGGATAYYTTYSFPSLLHIGQFIDGKQSNPEGNGRQDAVNSDCLVLWSFNPDETVFGTNTNWYLTQIREKGVRVIAIDTQLSKTAATQADEFVNVMPCTDAALLLAMMYHLLKNRMADIDVQFIKDHCFGFFDTGNTLYHADVDATKYTVPAGGSLSAFIMGTETDLVTATVNTATSIYPNTIGYEVNADDDLYGKTVKIWGQSPKTPEWAEKITGVPAAKIRELAEMYLDSKVSTWIGGGYQRHTEQEQAVWLNRIFSVVTKNFGAAGRSSGKNINNVTASTPSTKMTDGVTNGVNLKSTIYASDRMTSPTAYIPTGQMSNIPVFTVPDAVDHNNGTGASKWNYGQIKKLPAGFGKFIINFSGNIPANQSGDVNYNLDIYKDRSKCECLVTIDHFMTPSAAISDYVLPATMVGEKPGSANAWGTGEICLRINKIVDAPGEVLSEYEICTGIADKLGLKSDFLGGFSEGQAGMEERIKSGWDSGNLSTKYGMTYEEWCEKGVASLHTTYTSSQYVIKFKAFRDDPANNALSTPSGKFEAYSLNIMEDYEARYNENIDTSTTDSGGVSTLYGGGTIYSKYHGDSTARRFVYPIPMYIPAIEGRHAVDTTNPSDAMVHDDPLGCNAKGYTYTLHTWHLMYRSHSTLNNIAYLDENYKKDKNGNPAFLDPNREYTDGVWDDNVYEPIWLNPADAAELGLSTGDKALIENDRGKMYVSVKVTQRVPKKIIYIGQGSWQKKDAQGIDIGGNGNTVITARPSRICKGMTSANDCRVKITKA